MSTEAFADRFFELCSMDFRVLHREMEPLKAALDRAETVRIVASGTDLSFSIKGVECSISAGTWNIPDGETAMGIVRESANGRIAYNVPSSHLNRVFRDIALTFKDGRVVEVEADDREGVESILDALFDENIAGSLHFTPGGKDAEGKQCQVHWDLIQNHLPHFGGGEIWLDGKLWRKDGLFVDLDLQRLNPDVLEATLRAAGQMVLP